MRCAVVSLQYIVRPSGLKARPLLTVMSPAMRSQLAAGPAVQRGARRRARLVDRAHPEAALRVGLAVVEALLRRVVGRRRPGAGAAPLAGSKRHRPSRMASSRSPPGSGAQQPGSVSKRPVRVRAGGRVASGAARWPGMSHQYSAASSGCQNGDSPSSAGAARGSAAGSAVAAARHARVDRRASSRRRRCAAAPARAGRAPPGRPCGWRC